MGALRLSELTRRHALLNNPNVSREEFHAAVDSVVHIKNQRRETRDELRRERRAQLKQEREEERVEMQQELKDMVKLAKKSKEREELLQERSEIRRQRMGITGGGLTSSKSMISLS